MNLGEIRQWFVQESGRYDLVVDSTTWTDNGANRIINAAQRALDRMQTSPKSLGRNFQLVTVGLMSVKFQDCRAIKEVWCTDSVDGRTKLEKKSMEWLREEYNNFTDVDNGTPLYYAPAVLRAAPELFLQNIGTLSGYLSYMDVMYTSHYTYNGVLFMPPADETYMIETWAYFYSTQMTADAHESYWSVNHPEILVMAGQMMLEKFNRNTEGVKDWTAAIQQELTGIDRDLVEEEIADVNQMEG